VDPLEIVREQSGELREGAVEQLAPSVRQHEFDVVVRALRINQVAHGDELDPALLADRQLRGMTGRHWISVGPRRPSLGQG